MEKKLLVLIFLAFLSASSVQADILSEGQKARDTIGRVNSLQTQDGFSAQFWLTTDEQIFSTWTKPGAIRDLKPATQVKRNTPIYLALFIASPGMRNASKSTTKVNLVSDVTFDLYIISPNGSVSLAYKQRSGWKGNSPSPGLVYLAKDRGTLSFEAIDPLGEYSVMLILHDNVRKTDLKLTRKLELVE